VTSAAAAVLVYGRSRARAGAPLLVLFALGAAIAVLHVAASPSVADLSPTPANGRLPEALPGGSPFAAVVPAQPTARWQPYAQPVPLPRPPPARRTQPDTTSPPPGDGMGFLAVLAVAVAVAFLMARPRTWTWRRGALAALATLTLTGCSGSPIPEAATSAPLTRDYLSTALDWMEEHALTPDGFDWRQVRQDALRLAQQPEQPAQSYAAIRFVLRNLHDVSAFFLEPHGPMEVGELGISALYPDGTVVFVQPHSPAAQAGVRGGDMLETIDGEPLRPQGCEAPPAGYPGTWFVDMPLKPEAQFVIRRPGQAHSVIVGVAKTSSRYDGEPVAKHVEERLGYVELPWDGGWADYPTRAQRAIRAADGDQICGWIVDIRRNVGGDFWGYLAAIGPLLGEGDLGGFVFPSGARESWAYRGGKVLWAGQERGESYVEDPIYRPKRQHPPIAVLTSRATFAAGELVRVAVQGRPATRSFGEPTGGKPVLQLTASLRDGAFIVVSAARASDRLGKVYNGPIPPDQVVETDWTRFAVAGDPVIEAAVSWLRTQPGCGG
jgi:carboxyl-terminal processing protease